LEIGSIDISLRSFATRRNHNVVTSRGNKFKERFPVHGNEPAKSKRLMI
jgi:hypothetical protein